MKCGVGDSNRLATHKLLDVTARACFRYLIGLFRALRLQKSRNLFRLNSNTSGTTGRQNEKMGKCRYCLSRT